MILDVLDRILQSLNVDRVSVGLHRFTRTFLMTENLIDHFFVKPWCCQCRA